MDNKIERRVWKAMRKFAADQSLSAQEWRDLSELTMLDRSRLYFGPENIRWATSDDERVSNLAFYKSL